MTYYGATGVYMRNGGPLTVKTGDKVRVPSGEVGVVTDTFRKDGEERIEVTFPDGTWVTTSPEDVEKER